MGLSEAVTITRQNSVTDGQGGFVADGAPVVIRQTLAQCVPQPAKRTWVAGAGLVTLPARTAFTLWHDPGAPALQVGDLIEWRGKQYAIQELVPLDNHRRKLTLLAEAVTG